MQNIFLQNENLTHRVYIVVNFFDDYGVKFYVNFQEVEDATYVVEFSSYEYEECYLNEDNQEYEEYIDYLDYNYLMDDLLSYILENEPEVYGKIKDFQYVILNEDIPSDDF